jgi:hypothetical protein
MTAAPHEADISVTAFPLALKGEVRLRCQVDEYLSHRVGLEILAVLPVSGGLMPPQREKCPNLTEALRMIDIHVGKIKAPVRPLPFGIGRIVIQARRKPDIGFGRKRGFLGDDVNDAAER